jgi:hypothetical protein
VVNALTAGNFSTSASKGLYDFRNLGQMSSVGSVVEIALVADDTGWVVINFPNAEPSQRILHRGFPVLR